MKFVTRQEWGATAPKKSWTWLKPSRVQGIVIHHSGVEGGPTGKDAVRAFERHHMNTRGWSSIAYNWLVDVDGTIYEGRASGAVGGATKSWNFKTEAISYIGYGFEPLTLEAQQGIKQVIDYLQNKYGCTTGLWQALKRWLLLVVSLKKTPSLLTGMNLSVTCVVWVKG